MGLTRASATVVDNTFSGHFKFLGSSGLVGTWAAGPFSTDLTTKALIPNTDLTFVDDLAGQKVVIDYDTTTPVLVVDSLGANLFLIAEVTTASGEITAVADKRTPALQRSLVSEDLDGPIIETHVFTTAGSSYTERNITSTSYTVDGNAALIISLSESIKSTDRVLTSLRIDEGTELITSNFLVHDFSSTGWQNSSNMRCRTWYVPESSGELTGDLDVNMDFVGTSTGAMAAMVVGYNNVRQGNTPLSYLRTFEEEDTYTGSDNIFAFDAIGPGLWSTGGGLQSNEGLYLIMSAPVTGTLNPAQPEQWNIQPNEEAFTSTVTPVTKVASMAGSFWGGDTRATEITDNEVRMIVLYAGANGSDVGQGFVIPPALI